MATELVNQPERTGDPNAKFGCFTKEPMGNDGAEQRRVVLRVGEQHLEARDAAQPAARRLAHQLAFVARIRNKISRFLA